MIRLLVLLAFVINAVTAEGQDPEFKFLACGRGFEDDKGTFKEDRCDGVPLKVAKVDELHEVRCCSDEEKDGWRKYSSPAITDCTNWAEANLVTADGPFADLGSFGNDNNNLNGCVHAATYQQAEDICASHGAYVCTKEQVMRGCTRMSGCYHSDDHVWTSTPGNPSDVAALEARHKQAATIKNVCKGPTGRVWGDPHFITFDNLKYDCQGQGEFVIAKALGNDPLAIHGRFVRRFAPPSTKTKPTVTGSVAIKVLPENVAPIIQVTVPDQKINGKCPFTFTHGREETPVPNNNVVQFFKDNYNGAVHAFVSDKTVFFTFEATGTRVQVTAGGSNRCVLNTDLCLTPDNHGGANQIVGLLGTPTGLTSDDWNNGDGTNTNVPILPLFCTDTPWNQLNRQQKKQCKGPVNKEGHEWCMANWCVGDSTQSLWKATTHSMYNQCGDLDVTFFDNDDDPDDAIIAACAPTENPEECETDAVAEVQDGGNVTTFVDALQDEEDISKIVENLDDIVKIEELLTGIDGPVPDTAEANIIEINTTDIEDFVPADPKDHGNGPEGTGAGGDPHVTTWANEHYEYHGQCDLVLAKDANFAGGLGLEIHIRTKVVRFWSYIESVAIKIGNEILEIEGSADTNDAEAHYWLNFEYQGELETFAGFPVTQALPARYKRSYIMDLSPKFPGKYIAVELYKEFVRVRFNGNEQAFGNTVGLMGDYKTGETLARDGTTVMDDFTEFGDEWQVLPSEPKIFHEISHPQFPELCIKPEDPRGERKRRLEESTISIEQAEAACASLKDPLSIKDCVYDIMATQDLDMVGAF